MLATHWVLEFWLIMLAIVVAGGLLMRAYREEILERRPPDKKT